MIKEIKGHVFQTKSANNSRTPLGMVNIEYGGPNVGWYHRCLECKNCKLKIQEYEDDYNKILTCEEQIIKNIIE